MSKTTDSDPLFIIFERHLFRSSTEGGSTQEFIQAVVEDYMAYLMSQGVSIPISVKPAMVEDLTEEVREMTLKKTYGSVSVSGFQQDKKKPAGSTRKIAS